MSILLLCWVIHFFSLNRFITLKESKKKKSVYQFELEEDSALKFETQVLCSQFLKLVFQDELQITPLLKPTWKTKDSHLNSCYGWSVSLWRDPTAHQLKAETLTDTGQSVFATSVSAWERVFIKLSPHYHAWDMWAGAASSSLTRLGHIEVIFPGFTQHCVRREGYPVDPIALCEGGSASMNVAFEWREASRHADSLYLLYLGNRPDATSNSHNDVIMVPPPLPKPLSPSLSFSPFRELVAHESQGRSLQRSCCLPSYYSW